MGKHGKKQRGKRSGYIRNNVDGLESNDDSLPSSAYDMPLSRSPSQNQEESESNAEEDKEVLQQVQEHQQPATWNKFLLYQRSVQSPKGDISYMQKFFLMYIGGRQPLHLREDFCGTALISAQWLHSDPRRTALGVDLDAEALTWGLGNNIANLGSDEYSRVCLFQGNVLNSLDDAKTVKSSILDGQQDEHCMKETKIPWPAADIVCALNYSCCCLHKRSELLAYFQHARNAISRKGGIFIMDLYGGLSSEYALKLRRKYNDFTYVWEQEDFNIITRTTKISLHYFSKGNKHSLRHAFTYHWHLWTLPEIKDCLEEAGFSSVHFWIREMPHFQDQEESENFVLKDNTKYNETSNFKQVDAWNAYIVGVATNLKKRN